IADFTEIHTIVNVSQGQPILKKIPATPGVPGFTVFGDTIPCHDGEDIPFPEIPFTEYAPDRLTLRSAIDGCAFMDDGQIFVVPLLDIQENVDYSTGNINASVAIQVCQDVLSGFRVESLQDIIVKGTTEGGTLLSKRNIFLPGGVQGKREALIQAEQHIDAKFINEATVCAKGIIRVHGPVILSTLRCHRLDVEGNEAEIKGGLIEAVQDVIADSIGSERGAKTTIRLGYDLEELESRIAKSTEIIQKKKEKIQDEEQALETLRLFKQSNQGLPPSKEKLREKLETTLDHARASLAEKEAEHQTLLDTLQDARSMLRTIRVRSTMLSGTEVQIGPHSLVIKNPTGPATILVMNDALQILPFQDRSFIDEQEAMIE
ncbi:MAG: FapA family protein, partial [bacterium]|nr:FapA family protein [bacterium]